MFGTLFEHRDAMHQQFAGEGGRLTTVDLGKCVDQVALVVVEADLDRVVSDMTGIGPSGGLVVGSGTYDPREIRQQVLPLDFALGDFFDLSGARRRNGAFPGLPLTDKLRADAEASGQLSLGADVADCLMKGVHSG